MRGKPLEDEKEDGSFWGNAVVVIIAIGFTIGLIPITIMTFGPIVNSIRAVGWQESEAVVIFSVVNVPHRRQYTLEAEFRYVEKGEEYVSDRVFFDDTVGVRRLYYHEVSRELLRHKSASNPIRIWLNPAAPEQAVIYRHIRWDKFAANLFIYSIWSGITFLLVGAIWATFRK